MIRRYLELDLMRGVAIILMVVFHFSYDLNYFGFIDIDIYRGAFWHYFRDVIIFLFMISVGISLYIANEKTVNVRKNTLRLLKLFVVSLLISVVSYVIYPNEWIYFGIIHLIFVASLLAVGFVRYPKVALGIGVAILGVHALFHLDMHWLYRLSAETLSLPVHTQDIAHLFPWLGVVYIGIYIGYKKYFVLNLTSNKIVDKVTFLGRHALVIYLLHQPLLVALLMGIKKFIL